MIHTDVALWLTPGGDTLTANEIYLLAESRRHDGFQYHRDMKSGDVTLTSPETGESFLYPFISCLCHFGTVGKPS